MINLIKMKNVVSLVLLCVCLVVTKADDPVGSSPTVNVTLFYESLCPYSMRFFTGQLGPVWDELHDYINIQLVPYGHANQTYENGEWEFECQHGENECTYNILHACIINNISNVDKVVKILTCLMGSRLENLHFNTCIMKYHINENKKNNIETCVNSDQGKTLLSNYGNITKNFQPKIKYVPCPVFNGVFVDQDRVDSSTDFRGVVCKYLDPKPQKCQ